jgi:ATPase subunit of ABC transporter with duplicated ATPase domains
MADPLLRVEKVGKRFGGFVALEGIELSVAKGERLGLIGPNGSGKSTLVNCVCGTVTNDTLAGDACGIHAEELVRPVVVPANQSPAQLKDVRSAVLKFRVRSAADYLEAALQLLQLLHHVFAMPHQNFLPGLKF